MIRVSTNRDATRQALPILRDSDVSAYLRDGTLPPGVSFEGVPADKVVRNRGFWLVPKYQAHKVACMFLVSTDSPRMNDDGLEAIREPIFCYFSEKSAQHYLGHRRAGGEDEDGMQVLAPILDGQFPDIQIDCLTFVGKVISAK
ncbi:hypothetical protein Q042_05181 [Pseudomonas aeruginosa BWHPSA037]|nr:hypothetical protein Q042_05181 [Pseudomonas aeruginosa BWHPSA037]RPR83910.1 hypothetical protein IPC1038_22685 [Pseudomonas aeruginosa]